MGKNSDTCSLPFFNLKKVLKVLAIVYKIYTFLGIFLMMSKDLMILVYHWLSMIYSKYIYFWVPTLTEIARCWDYKDKRCTTLSIICICFFVMLIFHMYFKYEISPEISLDNVPSNILCNLPVSIIC